MTARRVRIAGSLVAFVLMLVVSLGISVPAYAREYSIPQVNIDATVTSDGSLEVREERLFSFDGSFNGVYWNLPQGEFQGRSVTVDVVEAGEMVDGAFVPYELSESGDNLTYQVQDRGYSMSLKIYARHSDETAHFVITYRINNVVLRHADVAELYWQFVTEGWDEESRNITCTVHLPVPAGQSVVPEDNVRAWGHGPIDASLAFNGNDIVYTVPGVGGSEFAEARATFPESWLPDAQQDTSTALPSILEEEQRWADEANARRMRARILYYGSMALAAVAAVGTSIFTFAKRKAYKEATRAVFDGQYFRDVPTKDHPAVLGALYSGGGVGGDEFTATLMELTNSNNIALQHVKVKRKGLFGGEKVEDDYRLVLTKQPATPNANYASPAEVDAHNINRKALYLMFDKVALGVSDEDYPNGTYPPLYFSTISDYAKEHSTTYENAYNSWQNAVENAYESRFTRGSTVVRVPTLALTAAGVLDIVLSILFVALGFVFGTPVPIIVVGFMLLVVAGIYAIFAASSTTALNQEGREVKAQLKALRNWLKDFTRLNEAIPTDVVLWNRLLVMAVVLGVADEVIKQLETVLPEVLHDDYMSSTYGWYYVSSTSNMSPARTFSDAVSTAHAVSTASEAGSSWSSGGGGGGGFSGGGGGGFGGGGGGGGGAF